LLCYNILRSSFLKNHKNIDTQYPRELFVAQIFFQRPKKLFHLGLKGKGKNDASLYTAGLKSSRKDAKPHSAPHP